MIEATILSSLEKEHKKNYKNAITTIEWDEDIPAYDVVLAEVEKARQYGL